MVHKKPIFLSTHGLQGLIVYEFVSEAYSRGRTGATFLLFRKQLFRFLCFITRRKLQERLIPVIYHFGLMSDLIFE